MPPAAQQIASRAVAIAARFASRNVKILSFEPLVTEPADLDTPSLQQIGIRDAAGVRLFMDILPQLVPDGAQNRVSKLQPNPQSILGDIEEQVENAIIAIPAPVGKEPRSRAGSAPERKKVSLHRRNKK